MKTNQRASLLVAASLAVSMTLGQASPSLISDDFSGVDASDFPVSSGLNAANWFFVGQVGGTPWTTGEDSVSPLSGTVLENQGSSSSWQYAVKQFSPATLRKTGDTLTVKLDYHVANTTTDAHLDVALLHSANRIENNSFAEQDSNPLLNAKGYSAYQLCKATPTTNSFVKINNGAEDFESPKATLTSNSDPSVLGDALEAHTLLLSITKGESEVEMTWSIDGVVVGSAADGDSPFNVFNTLRLMAPSDTQTHLDNILVIANIQKP